MQALLSHDAFSPILRHTGPRELLLLSMTTVAANRGFDCNSFWEIMFNTFYASTHTRQYRELEYRPTAHMRATSARRLCGLLAFSGCEHCDNRRIRKVHTRHSFPVSRTHTWRRPDTHTHTQVYMPFMRRLCETCFNDATIQEKFLCASTGQPSLQALLEHGVDLHTIPHRTTYYDILWGCVPARFYLRVDIERLLRESHLPPPDYTHMDERRARVVAIRDREKNTRRARQRWRLASHTLGVLRSDLKRSPTLRTFVYDAKNATRKLTHAVQQRIQRELWHELVPGAT